MTLLDCSGQGTRLHALAFILVATSQSVGPQCKSETRQDLVNAEEARNAQEGGGAGGAQERVMEQELVQLTKSPLAAGDKQCILSSLVCLLRVWNHTRANFQAELACIHRIDGGAVLGGCRQRTVSTPG